MFCEKLRLKNTYKNSFISLKLNDPCNDNIRNESFGWTIFGLLLHFQGVCITFQTAMRTEVGMKDIGSVELFSLDPL